MKTTRRHFFAGALAIPAASSMAGWQWRHGHGTVFVYDGELAQGRAGAATASAWNKRALAVEGDRIRFARELLESRPAVLRGVTRQADMVLIEEVAQEAGYERTALEVDGDALTWTLMPRIRARG